MTFERSATPPAEPGPAPVGGGPPVMPTPVQLRLQILATEHWSLLASRSLAWNEMFARAGMYLSTLSGSMVALGLIGGIAGFDAPFFVFALTILPVVLFIGIGTWLRMGGANYHDAQTLVGMNRIRGAYLEIAPELEPYFVMGVHDDPPGIGITMAVPPETPVIVHIVASTPFLVLVLNGVVAGAIAALLGVWFDRNDLSVPVLAGLIVAIGVVALELAYAAREIRTGQQTIRPLFPTPGATPDPNLVHGARVPKRSDGASGDRPEA